MGDFKIIHSVGYKECITQKAYILSECTNEGSIGALYDCYTDSDTIYEDVCVVGEIKLSKGSYTKNALSPFNYSNLYDECKKIKKDVNSIDGYIRITDGKDSYLYGISDSGMVLIGLLKVVVNIDIFTKIKSILGK